jgi:hypothetical protein
MLRSLLRIQRVVSKELGHGLRALPTGFLIVAVQVFARTTLWLDHVFFPGFAKAKIDRPIFIIGNPRSGTTVLHRFLHSSGQVCSFRVWQMFVPSITGQLLLRPLVPAFARLNPARHYANEAHETGLDSIETDEALFSFRFLDGLFTFLFFMGWSAEDELGKLIEHYAEGSKANARDLAYYESCLRRLVYVSRKGRVLGKPFTFVLRIRDVLEAFPDARLLYLVRDPLEVIPSGINMVSKVTDKQFNTSALPAEVRQRYYENLYRGECELYREFFEVYSKGGIPDKNLMIVRFPDLMRDFEGVMDKVMEFSELPVTDEFREAIRAQAEKQRHHASKHEYSLDAFGITEERVRSDLRFVYETWEL